MRDRVAVLPSTVLAVLVGCSTPPPDPQPEYAPRAVVELERWRIRSGGHVVGTLLRYEIQDPSGPLRFWRIENAHGQWLGHATDLGRFSRRVPFRDDEEDLGIWPMRAGVAQLFEASAVDLEPVALDAVMHKSAK
ncbi:MAG: hypothetical protein IPK26_01015 [Planctomycetes bacterium]|nr:hypothetical protein [Planctomycetota bacterium]